MNHMRALFSAFVLLVYSSSGTASTIVMDQNTVPYVTDSGGFFVGQFYDMVQTFTVGVDGRLASIEVLIGKVPATSTDLEFSLWTTRPDGLRDTMLAHVVRPVEDVAHFGYGDDNWQLFDLLSYGFRVRPGDVLAITMAAPGALLTPVSEGYYWHTTDATRQVPTNDYLGGTSHRCYNGVPALACEERYHDYIFRTSVELVPIPAAAWLFGSALFGLGWYRRSA